MNFNILKLSSFDSVGKGAYGGMGTGFNSLRARAHRSQISPLGEVSS
jgi:hypothetical protein